MILCLRKAGETGEKSVGEYGYARYADKIPSEVLGVNKNNAVEKIEKIAKQTDLIKAIADNLFITGKKKT